MMKKKRKSLFFQEKRWKSSLPKEAAGLAADWKLERRTTASEAAGSGSKATPLLELCSLFVLAVSYDRKFLVEIVFFSHINQLEYFFTNQQ